MIDDVLREHLGSGVSVIVGTVSGDGAPYASKGFGVVAVGDDVVQVFLDARELALLDNIRATSRLSVTTGDVYTHQSVQLKGRAESLEESTAGEHAAALTLMRRFNEKIGRLQDLPVEAFESQLPPGFFTCTTRIYGVFDQSPGPMAGTPLGSRVQ
jgi:hypothetical protein